MGKSLFLITSRLLWPVTSGRKMSLVQYCRCLHQEYGYDIYLYAFPEKDQSVPEQVPSYIKSIRLAREISLVEKAANLVRYSFGKKKWPFQCSLFFSRENVKSIRAWIEEIRPDVIMTEMIRTAPYIQAFGENDAIKLCNIDDLLSKRYQRQLEASTADGNVAGVYGGKLPSFLRRITQIGWIKNMVLRGESCRCALWEDEFYRQYDHLLFTSKIETAEINRRMHDSKASTLSIAVDDSFFNRVVNAEKESRSISIVGNFNYAANSASLAFICNQVLPKIKGGYSFYVIGAYPPEVKRRWESDERIHFCGVVEDLAAAVTKTMVFLSPVVFGTGIKTKIVEAMAMGMPVVTNAIGAEGMDVMDGRELLLAETPEEIAQAVERLMQDETLRLEMGQRAQAYARANHDWREIQRVFGKMGL